MQQKSPRPLTLMRRMERLGNLPGHHKKVLNFYYVMVRKLIQTMEEELELEQMRTLLWFGGPDQRPESVMVRVRELELERKQLERELEVELECELVERQKREEAQMRLKLRDLDSDESESSHLWRLFWWKGQQERKELERELKREFAIAKTLGTEQRWLVIWSEVKKKVESRRTERLKANGARQREIEEERSVYSKVSAAVQGKLWRLNLITNLNDHISVLHSRMSSMPLGVVDRTGNLERAIMKSVDDDDISNKLSKAYLMFQDHIKGYSKALDHSSDKDPGVEILVKLCKSMFLKLIASFDSKRLEERANHPDVRDHNHPISSILSYKPHMESLETGLQMLSRIDVAFPSEERSMLSQKLVVTHRDVSHLEDAAKYAGYLTIATVFSWIAVYAPPIRRETSRISKGFQRYSAFIIKALPFWEFLPYDGHYEEHVNGAVEYLLGRKLSLRCTHFLAAFRCLKSSDCLHAL